MPSSWKDLQPPVTPLEACAAIVRLRNWKKFSVSFRKSLISTMRRSDEHTGDVGGASKEVRGTNQE